MGMYRGHKPFDREQLIFIVEASLCAAFDKVHGALPTGSSKVGGSDLAHWNEHKEELLQFLWGAVHHVGIFVPILWAQTEGDDVSDIDIPENSQSTYRSETFEPTVAIDSEGNEYALQ